MSVRPGMQGPPPSQSEGVAAVVEPIKAGGAVLGFAIGFAAAWRSGADLTAAAMHGLVGAALLWALAWWVGLFLVREMMLAHVEEQRVLYSERVARIQAQAAATRQGEQEPEQTLVAPPVPRAALRPPGS
jgi:hypothetical protein